MGVTKTELFSPRQNQLAAFAKVFAHPARVAIIEHLLAADTCCNSDLVGELGLAQATISQHLKELKTAGILRGTVEGVSVNYCIDADQWQACQAAFLSLFEGYQPPACHDDC